MMPRATVWVKIPVQLEVGVVERAVVLEERPGMKNPAALTSRVASACWSASCRRPPACGPRSSPSFQAFLPSSCAWAALLVAYEQAWSPCPPRTPSNQVLVRVRRLERVLVCEGEQNLGAELGRPTT